MTASTETEIRGLTLNLYRTPESGVSPERNLLHAVHQVTLTEIHFEDGRKSLVPQGMRVLRPTVERPAVALVQRKIFGDRDTWHIRPVDGPRWLMAGGTFAATSDSRFGELTKSYCALAVHDWDEN